MSDREMLKLAAKAAGIECCKFQKHLHVKECWWYGDHEWNPLTADGDAFRLMVKLGMIVEVQQGWATNGTAIYFGIDDEENKVWEEHGTDPEAATRRAITRAAAEIGRNMK